VTITQYLDQLGSDEVQGELMLASTWGAFIRRWRENLWVGATRAYLISHRDDIQAVVDHCWALWESPCPEGYSHPQDTTLATCLCLLEGHPFSAARNIALQIHDSHDPRLFWARGAAAYVLNLRGHNSGTCDTPQRDRARCVACGGLISDTDWTHEFTSDHRTHDPECAQKVLRELKPFLDQLERQFAEERGEKQCKG
jgi:hypothetical protein